MDQQNEMLAAGIKQQAWDILVNGGSTKDFPPDLPSRLGPEMEATLSAYEKRRDSGDKSTDFISILKRLI